MKTWNIILISLTLFLLLGCAPLSQAETVLSTLPVLETETIPESTPVPTETPTAVPTLKPTQTPFPTASSERAYPDVFTFSVPDKNGETYSLESLQGTPFMMLFFSVQCGHCHNEAQHLEDLFQTYQEQGFTIVAFEVSLADYETVTGFVEEYGLTFPVLSDADRSLAYQMGVTGVPSNFFIDANGEIVDQIIGFRDTETLQAAIESLLEH